MPSFSIVAVHSLTAKSSAAWKLRPRKRSVGLLRKMAAMCSRTASAPSARSPAVWFSKTISGWCIEATASMSCVFHASL